MTLKGSLINFTATHHARFINNSLSNIVGFQTEGGPLENGRLVLLYGEGADNEFAHNRFEDNLLIGTKGPALRIYGSGHLVQRNTIKNTKGNGISLNYGMGSGLDAITHRVTTTDGRYIDNIIEGVKDYGLFLGFGKGHDYTGHKRVKEWNTGVIQNIPPSGNVITGNVISNSTLAPIEIAGANDNIIKDNMINE